MLSRLAVVARQGARAGLCLRQGTASLTSSRRFISTSPESQSNSVPEETKAKGVLDYYRERAGLSEIDIDKYEKINIEEEEDEARVIRVGEEARYYREKRELGPTVFGIGLATFLLSKEIFVINDEALLLFLSAGTITMIVKKVGKQVGDMLDSESNAILESINAGKQLKMKSLQDAIEQEEEVEKVFECRSEVFDILKENNTMRLEVEYRNRLHEVHDEVKKRLDYQVDMQNLEKRLEREHIIKWIEDSVVQSVTAKQEKDALNQCIKDLNAISL